MDRLTEYVDDKYIRIKGTSSLYPAKERKGAPASNAIVRLAAYEDTGRAPEEMQWINTTDRRPNQEEQTNNAEFIVMIEGAGTSTTLFYDDQCGGGFFEEDSDGAREYYRVTRWMPMPAPTVDE